MYAPDLASIATPIGVVTIETIGNTIVAIRLSGEHVSRGTSSTAIAAADQLAAWFAGERKTFSLDLAPPASPRGAMLRAALIDVGYGETMSYGALARLTRSSPRAIGQLCARNPFPIVVPCHRILGANGALGAYSAGDGPATKAWLLAHEQRHRPFTLSG